MSVLDRGALQDSPLADLHTIASELSIDGYRRLRKAELIDLILERQGGAAPQADEPEAAEAAAPKSDEDASAPPRRRGRRGGRGRSAGPREEERAGEDDAPADAAGEEGERTDSRERTEAEQVVEGMVELLPNGSGFIRVEPPDPSDDDVYISAAQVKRCELVSGDRIAGPRRRPRRSERFASLIRIDTINGRPASELADSTRFEDLRAAFPSERLELGTDDPTVKAIEWLTPFGKGSRVLICGPSRSGKSEALRRLAGALSGRDGLELSIVLAGVRPEEVAEWHELAGAGETAVPLGASPDALGAAIEAAIDQARRLAARGSDVVVLIDTLDGAPSHAIRRALGSARNIVDGGSLTVLATSASTLGGETTVIALDGHAAATGHFPALDLLASGVLRPELLVGEAGAEAIARARAEAAGPR